MRRLVLLAAALLTLGSAGLAAPECAFACSCVPPGDLASYRDTDTVIVVGRTGVRVGNDVPLAVERWFWGEGIAPVVPLVPADTRMPDGTTAYNTCGVDLPADRHLILVAYRDPADGRLHPSICSPIVDAETDEGQALLAEAVATFGDGVAPVPTSEPESAGGDALLLAVAIVGAALGTALLIGTMLVVGRRGSG
jgi:hypothetical protein